MKKYSIIVILLILFIFQNCTKRRAENVFLITLDTTRADFIDFSENGDGSTPNLAKLANKGFYFSNAYSVIPITLPSHASMLYSQYPHNIGILNNGDQNREKHLSLPQILKHNGYSTGAVISLGVLKSDFGLNRGFDDYIDSFKKFIWTKNAQEVNEEVKELIKKKKSGKNFFWIHYSDPHEPYLPPSSKGTFSLILNGEKIISEKSGLIPYIRTDLIIPPGISRLDFITDIPSREKRIQGYKVGYITYKDFQISKRNKIKIKFPQSWEKRGNKSENYYSDNLSSTIVLINSNKKAEILKLSFIYTMHIDNRSKKKLYKKSVEYMDKEIGELLSFLKKEGELNKSVFVIMGDHGEGLGEYLDNYGHIHYLNKLYTRVPFIVSGCGISSKGEKSDLVSNLNIAPTILQICGMKIPDFMEGESVLNRIKKTKLILETFSPEAYFDAYSLIEFPYQIIFYPGRKDNRIEFIDLLNDPLGIKGITDNEIKKKRDKMLKSILDISRTIIATKRKPGKKRRVHREILRSLGYL